MTTRILINCIIVAACCFSATAQITIKNKFGKGIRFIAEDSSFAVKMNTRVQNRYDGFLTLTDDTAFTDSKYADKMWIRRARIKFSGFAWTPKLTYKIEYDMVNGQVLDAVVIWNFAGNFSLWAGQTKLPGNRERVISSQNLQFVDRSLLNSNYNIDRDKGLQLRHHFKVGEMVIREMSSLSIGEGKNYTALNPNSGYDWTQRIEFLPFGKFTGKGDYFGGDLKREETLKLALGATFDYNDDAIREKGQRGDELAQSRDITTLFVDMMLKYKGLSLMAEYADKSTTSAAAFLTFDGSVWITESYLTGTGLNLQLGYLLKSNWELAGRFTQITPEDITGKADVSAYTFGLSRYIVGHSLKFQSDISLIQAEGSDDMLEFRLQFELGL
ncbi:MAG: porin [Flavobacteriales bacterium]|nr:porin [Flavobacteriales bacterium]